MVIPVSLKENSYDIIIENNILEKVEKYFSHHDKYVIVTDDGVPKEYIEKVKNSIKEEVFVFSFEQGEKSKNFDTLINLLTFIQKCNLSRKDAIISICGGVGGDLGAFASSIYMRGIDFYNIPTTFLSMVDSSSGGKTGIDFNGIKNAIGTFKQPKKVLIDPTVLKTLSQRQISCGLCESFKMASCLDKELFNLMISGVKEEDYEYIIQRSCFLKKDIVEKDEKELSLRKVLNFGHTLGHGIEESSNGKLLHGECVGLGMIAMSNGDVKEKIEIGLKNLGLPTKGIFDIEEAIHIIAHDKKKTKDGISCVVVNEIGSFEFYEMDLNLLKSKLELVWEE